VTQPQSRFRCADAARERADPLAGSAPQTRRWLLLEHPGPWAIDAVAGAGIEPSVLNRLNVAAQQAMARILLIRRHGRRSLRAQRRWTVTGLNQATVRGTWQSDDDLLAAANALISGSQPGAGPVEPIVLVCTHGVHDTCCALRGRPVAAVLARRWPERVWECSHVGGDRFAPNVLVLPDGFYYGNLDAELAVGTIERHFAGDLATEYLRGMASYPPPVQAAVIATYERCRPLGPSEVTVRAVEQKGRHEGHGSETIVELEVPVLNAAFRVEILSVRRREAQLTCRAVRETPATEYQLRRYDRIGYR
jgi:hypothetical protein